MLFITQFIPWSQIRCNLLTFTVIYNRKLLLDHHHKVYYFLTKFEHFNPIQLRHYTISKPTDPKSATGASKYTREQDCSDINFGLEKSYYPGSSAQQEQRQILRGSNDVSGSVSSLSFTSLNQTSSNSPGTSTSFTPQPLISTASILADSNNTAIKKRVDDWGDKVNAWYAIYQDAAGISEVRRSQEKVSMVSRLNIIFIVCMASQLNIHKSCTVYLFSLNYHLYFFQLVYGMQFHNI